MCLLNCVQRKITSADRMCVNQYRHTHTHTYPHLHQLHKREGRIRNSLTNFMVLFYLFNCQVHSIIRNQLPENDHSLDVVWSLTAGHPISLVKSIVSITLIDPL